MLALSILASCGGAAAETAALEVSDFFLLALKKGTWITAFNRLDPGLKDACGNDPRELARRAIARFEARLTDWELRVESRYRDNVVLGGEVEREGRAPVTVGIVAEGGGEQWLITTFEVDAVDLCLPLAEAGSNPSLEEE